MATYYSSKLTLAASTALFTDSGLVIPAPNGYYSSDNIVRQQTSGELISGSNTCITICPPPPYVILTLRDFYSDSINPTNFKFQLKNNTLPFNIGISSVMVYVWQSQGLCLTNAFAELNPTCNPCTLLSGTSEIISYGPTYPTCAGYIGRYYRVIDSIKLTIAGNDYTLHNEEKLTIGGWDIFIELNPYCFPVITNC